MRTQGDLDSSQPLETVNKQDAAVMTQKPSVEPEEEGKPQVR